MRFRSVKLGATALGASVALGGALLRCTLPDLPPPPAAQATRVGLPRGAIVSLPAGSTLDRAALVASLKELKAITVILEASADATGQSVAERVALAIDLQRELDADVLVGTYRASAYSGKPMDVLLQKDAAFTSCVPGGPRLDAELPIIDKLRLCSQDVSTKIADALAAANASPRVGCYITHEPELAAALSAEGRTKLGDLLRDSASACTSAKRLVAYSTLVTAGSGDPATAGLVLRDVLAPTGVNLVMLHDGVASVDPAKPRRGAPYYLGVRTALADRPPVVNVWATVDAFDCATPGCDRTRPTASARFTEQLCGARFRVEGIITREYLHDFAGRPLVTSAGDASPDLQAILDDADASAQLRSGYLAWADAGAPCP
ncbi:MAG TPA: hypothetical protein VLT33_17605 [Labilithrix sp.]|nr:hypothetical protein [Labilithrix sp.]